MSTTMELVDVSRVYWKEIAKKCNKAVVFIENSAAERYEGIVYLENCTANSCSLGQVHQCLSENRFLLIIHFTDVSITCTLDIY